MEILQQIILGIVQGIMEWIPISSEGALFLVNSNFFGNHDVEFLLKQALLLHIGTFFAALIYFRKEVRDLMKGLSNYRSADPETKKTLNFLFVSTIISGIIGLAILNFIDLINVDKLPLTSAWINIFIGLLLILTGTMQLKSSRAGYKKEYHLNNKDGVILGIAQGFSALPGLSRSGLTISMFLFRNFDETTALKLSFIMSLPIVLLGNLLLNFRNFSLINEMILGVFVAFAVGILTIHIFMEFSKKVKFGFFALAFGILVIIAGILNFFF